MGFLMKSHASGRMELQVNVLQPQWTTVREAKYATIE